MLTNGREYLEEASCKTFANTSLPEPVGPVIKVVTSASATFSAKVKSFLLSLSTKT